MAQTKGSQPDMSHWAQTKEDLKAQTEEDLEGSHYHRPSMAQTKGSQYPLDMNGYWAQTKEDLKAQTEEDLEAQE